MKLNPWSYVFARRVQYLESPAYKIPIAQCAVYRRKPKFFVWQQLSELQNYKVEGCEKLPCAKPLWKVPKPLWMVVTSASQSLQLRQQIWVHSKLGTLHMFLGRATCL